MKAARYANISDFFQQETVFKLGDIKDPISGEMVVGPNYRLGLDLNLS